MADGARCSPSFDLLSKMYLLNASSYNATRSNYWQVRAEQRKAAVLDLFWDPERFAFYDFNTTSNARAQYWSVASYYPYWSGYVSHYISAFYGKEMLTE